MPSNILTTVAEKLTAAQAAYHSLVLLVGPVGAGKTQILSQLATEQGGRVMNLNLLLTERLLELTHRKRALRVSALVEELVADLGTETVLVDNLEILFSTALELDPLKLLQQLSRHRTVVAAWPGSIEGDSLTYASSGHPEHRRYTKPDATLVDVGDIADHASHRHPSTDPIT